MFGISFEKNHKSDCRVMLAYYMTTDGESVNFSRDFVIIQHFHLCNLFSITCHVLMEKIFKNVLLKQVAQMKILNNYKVT